MTVETAKMSERGQIIIPKGIREFIHAGENTIFTVMPLDDETIVMRKLDKVIKEFREIRRGIRNKLSDKEINEEIHAARKSK